MAQLMEQRRFYGETSETSGSSEKMSVSVRSSGGGGALSHHSFPTTTTSSSHSSLESDQ